ncbi:Hypothetical predicted protein [Cloeon dipterum]|nr:Hypothetical predicted protein [Cloeon dipterum]
MQNLMFAFAALAALALAAAAPKDSDNNCPSFEPMTNFNASEMVGVWYDIAHTNRRTGLKLKCDLVKFSPDLTDPSKLEFNSFSYSSATKSVVSVAGKICSPTKKNVPDGTIAVTIPSLSKKKSKLNKKISNTIALKMLRRRKSRDESAFNRLQDLRRSCRLPPTWKRHFFS